MSTSNIPPVPENSFRVIIKLEYAESRMDKVLLTALHNQTENQELMKVTRSGLKSLFANGKIVIKGQVARPASGLAKGITYIDIRN
jgi:hypothetical protein